MKLKSLGVGLLLIIALFIVGLRIISNIFFPESFLDTDYSSIWKYLFFALGIVSVLFGIRGLIVFSMMKWRVRSEGEHEKSPPDIYFSILLLLMGTIIAVKWGMYVVFPV